MSQPRSFIDMLKIFFTRRMMVSMCMGFSAGMPLLLTGSTLQAWMKDEGLSLSKIGLVSLLGLPYTLKFLWSPLLDRYTLPFLGRRRGWLCTIQVVLACTIMGVGMSHPAHSTYIFVLLVLLVAFFSASQDIVIDAYRREDLADNELGLGSSLYVNGYRIAMLVSGAGALALADSVSWPVVYAIMGLMMVVGILTTLWTPEPQVEVEPPKTLHEAVIEPFLEYAKRDGAGWILLFILLYKIGDSMASNMTMPLFLELGFSKLEIAAIAKSFGFFATIGGVFLGGFLMLRIGIHKALWIFGVLMMLSTAGFSVLAYIGYDRTALAAVIVIENLTSGLGTAAFLAFMASLTDKRFTATQYALLSSLAGVPRVIASAPTGYFAQQMGWVLFFLFCVVCALPGMYLLLRVAPWNGASDTQSMSERP